MRSHVAYLSDISFMHVEYIRQLTATVVVSWQLLFEIR